MSLDQISRMQINASVGGECATDAALENWNGSAAYSRLAEAVVGNATQVASSL